MRTMKTKLAALALAALLVFGFTACASSAVREHSPSPSPSSTPDLDYAAAYAKYAPDTATMTINGVTVPWSEYFYWLHGIISQYFTSTGGTPDWGSMYDDTNTVQQTILSAVQENIKSYNVMLTQAQSQNIALTDADWQALNDQWKSDVTGYAAKNSAAADTTGLSDDQIFAQQEQEFTDYLSSVYVPKAMYDKLSQVTAIYQDMLTSMFGENASKITDEEALSWAEDQGYMAAKHILFLTVDPSSNTALDAATIAQKKQAAEDTLAALKATPADQLVSTFDTLMKAKSEDPGLSTYPNGYCFNDNSNFDQAFVDATKNLQPGQMTTDLVQSSSGFHIILRVALTPDMVPIIANTNNTNNTFTLRELTAQGHLGDLLKGWADEATVAVEPDFQNLDLAALFGTASGDTAATATPAS